MYKCYRCKAVFDSPAEKMGEVDYYPRPFGNGMEPYGGGIVDCCPCCDSEDFGEVEFDGKHCPYCDSEIEFEENEDVDNFEKTCKKCNCDIIVVDGMLKE